MLSEMYNFFIKQDKKKSVISKENPFHTESLKQNKTKKENNPHKITGIGFAYRQQSRWLEKHQHYVQIAFSLKIAGIFFALTGCIVVYLGGVASGFALLFLAGALSKGSDFLAAPCRPEVINGFKPSKLCQAKGANRLIKESTKLGNKSLLTNTLPPKRDAGKEESFSSIAYSGRSFHIQHKKSLLVNKNERKPTHKAKSKAGKSTALSP